MERSNINSNIQTNNTRSSVSVHRNRIWSWFKQSYNNSKNNGSHKRNRHYKYLPAIISLLFATPSYAETVGGVSATAAPVANSSGSVTNQAIQVLSGTVYHQHIWRRYSVSGTYPERYSICDGCCINAESI